MDKIQFDAMELNRPPATFRKKNKSCTLKTPFQPECKFIVNGSFLKKKKKKKETKNPDYFHERFEVFEHRNLANKTIFVIHDKKILASVYW